MYEHVGKRRKGKGPATKRKVRARRMRIQAENQTVLQARKYIPKKEERVEAPKWL